jgi:hypothetical protein
MEIPMELGLQNQQQQNRVTKYLVEKINISLSDLAREILEFGAQGTFFKHFEYAYSIANAQVQTFMCEAGRSASRNPMAFSVLAFQIFLTKMKQPDLRKATCNT